jgi:hypothetical protein
MRFAGKCGQEKWGKIKIYKNDGNYLGAWNLKEISPKGPLF